MLLTHKLCTLPLQPEQVARVEKELERILQGGGARDMEVEEVLEDDEEEEGADGES